MAGSVNKVIILGHLGADPEIKSFQNGGRIATFRVATSESWKDRQTGDRKERTEWHSVTIGSDGLVGVAERFLRKGSKVYIEGQLRTRKWQDQNGNDRYTTEVSVGGHGGVLTMLDNKPDDQRGGEWGDQQRGRSNDRGGNGGGRNDRWADGGRGDREVYSGDRGGWQENGRDGRNGSANDGWGNSNGGGGFGDDLDDDIPFMTCASVW